jgi:hypothetical protein
MRRISVLPLLALLTIGAFPGTAPAAGPPELFTVDRAFYPYYPSLLRWEQSGAKFTDPATCGECHPQQHEEWVGSVHALAFQDPIYQGELNKATKAVGHDIARQCEGCHTAAAMVTGETKGAGLAGLSPLALAGVSCDVCHSVSGVTHCQTPTREPENGSLVLNPGVDTPAKPQLVKRAPFPPPEGCGDDFHRCEHSPLHLRADLCAGCHQVFHYEKHFPLEATYAEWKASAYAQHGIQCQDCHMVETETFRRSADTFEKPKREEYRHYFNGANYLLYFLARSAARKAGDDGLVANLDRKYQMAVARLRAAADLQLTPVYRQGRLTEVRVRVRNLRAGHNLPTSLTNVRQMWLEVKVEDPSGKVILAAGAPDADGKLLENARIFNSDGVGNDFHFAVDPWVITSFSRHDTIPPRGYKDAYFGVPVPADGQTVVFRAKLRYRQAEQAVAEALLGAVPKDIDLQATYGLTSVPPLPIVDMAETAATFASRE